MLKEIELVIDQSAIEFANAIGMTEKIGARVRKIISRRVGNVVRNLDLFHLTAVNGVGAEIARNGRHRFFLKAERPPS